jgi:hypothetical protein
VVPVRRLALGNRSGRWSFERRSHRVVAPTRPVPAKPVDSAVLSVSKAGPTMCLKSHATIERSMDNGAGSASTAVLDIHVLD